MDPNVAFLRDVHGDNATIDLLDQGIEVLAQARYRLIAPLRFLHSAHRSFDSLRHSSLSAHQLVCKADDCFIDHRLT
jgi:hypothetical protein